MPTGSLNESRHSKKVYLNSLGEPVKCFWPCYAGAVRSGFEDLPRLLRFGAGTLPPESFFCHFLLLVDEVEVHLCHLKLSDIVIGGHSGGELNMIFHVWGVCNTKTRILYVWKMLQVEWFL